MEVPLDKDKKHIKFLSMSTEKYFEKKIHPTWYEEKERPARTMVWKILLVSR